MTSADQLEHTEDLAELNNQKYKIETQIKNIKAKSFKSFLNLFLVTRKISE